MEEIKVNDSELLQLLDQFDDVSFRQAYARLSLLRKFELPLQFKQFFIHLWLCFFYVLQEFTSVRF